MEEPKLITVIIPIYNAEKYLEEAIKSVINQTLKNIELILINLARHLINLIFYTNNITKINKIRKR